MRHRQGHAGMYFRAAATGSCCCCCCCDLRSIHQPGCMSYRCTGLELILVAACTAGVAVRSCCRSSGCCRTSGPEPSIQCRTGAGDLGFYGDEIAYRIQLKPRQKQREQPQLAPSDPTSTMRSNSSVHCRRSSRLSSKVFS